MVIIIIYVMPFVVLFGVVVVLVGMGVLLGEEMQGGQKKVWYEWVVVVVRDGEDYTVHSP